VLDVEWLVLTYLAYVTGVAWLRARPRRARLVVTAVAAADGLLIAALAASASPAVLIVRHWLPALQILVGYRLSGMLYVRPMIGLEQRLLQSDERIAARLGARRILDATPTAVLAALEYAYLSVTPMIPLGFGLVYALAPAPDVDRYWTVVVAAALACYGMLPWLQTRPPFAVASIAAIERRAPRVRRFARAFMHRVSIHVNTLPSGHAAGSAATALAVWEQVPAAGPALAVWSFCIIAGSLVGRYHYAVDAVAGVAVACLAWFVAPR
jgi:hypothetical protein